MKKIYLAHSVHERELGKEIQAMLEDMGFIIWNPFYPPSEYHRGDIEKLDKGIIVPWDIPDKDRSNWIIKIDLRAVGWSDFIICIFPNRRTVGIPCEMTYAWMSHIPVYAVTPSDMAGHPWIVGMCEKVFTDIGELYEYLEENICTSGKEG